MRDHIDDRIADADDIDTSLRHLRMNYLSEELRAAEYRGNSPAGKRRRPPPVPVIAPGYSHAYGFCLSG